MTGVSATGRAILVPAGGCSGDLNPFGSAGLDFEGRPLFRDFLGWSSSGSRVREERVAMSGCGSCSVSAELAAPLVVFRVGSSVVCPFTGTAPAPAFSPVRFLGGRPLRGVDFGGAFSTSE